MGSTGKMPGFTMRPKNRRFMRPVSNAVDLEQVARMEPCGIRESWHILPDSAIATSESR